MAVAIALVICGSIGYLLGSIPTGYWLGLAIAGIDIREQGSGSTGATNVLRTLGKVPALVVLSVDLLKGALSVIVAEAIVSGLLASRLGLEDSLETLLPWCAIAGALMAIIGHSKSFWIGFKGGKIRRHQPWITPSHSLACRARCLRGMDQYPQPHPHRLH